MDIKTLLLVALAGILVLGAVWYFSQANGVRLTVDFSSMDALVGQALSIRVVEEQSGVEVARQTISSIAGPTFQVRFANLKKGTAYRVDFYADTNGNGVYDAPPVDQAWRIAGLSLEKDATISFSPTADLVDIAWPETLVVPTQNPGTTSPPASSTVTVDGVIASGEYRHSLEDPMTGIRIYWQNDHQTLNVGLVSPGTGWVAVGFDPQNGMQGANIIMAAVSGSRLTIEDQFGTSPISHSPDGSQDVLVSAGREAGDKTTVEFSIPLDSGDPADTALLPGTTHTIMLAYQDSSDDFQIRHTKRAASSLTLDP